VFDAGSATGSAQSAIERDATRVATLPEATSSFGAAATDGWLYVYGGHVVPTHSYSTEAVSGKFNRLRLADGKTWERLPDGPPLQGMNLAAHGGKIYRVGGMQPQNKPGEPQDIQSVADVARFDPATGKWEALPPLPVARSSHDVVVVGNTLVVVGGWTLKGKEKTEWPDSIELLDLSAPTLTWTRVPQPFKRRALIAAAIDGKVYALGGFNEQSQVVHTSAVYDVARRTWSGGPDLPGGAMNGFGPAATVVSGSLFVSVDDGGLYRMNASMQGWTRVGRATPRIVHRLVADGHRVLVLGGALSGKNSDLIEAIEID
jgi:Kelch motif